MIENEDDFRTKWESILAELDIKSIPLTYIKDISITLPYGKTEVFNVKSLVEKKMPVRSIQAHLESFLFENDSNSEGDLDVQINVEALSGEVTLRTRKLLG